MITTHQLSFRYNPNAPTPVLDDITLQIENGSFVLICGASGSGKSTLIRTFNGLIPHQYGGVFAGEVWVNGLDTRSQRVGDMCTAVGMIFQNPEAQLFTSTVEHELAFGLESLRLPRDAMRTRIDETASLLDISHLLPRNPRMLSGGEQQLVAIAAMLAMRPPLLVLDEPFASLDPANSERVRDALRTIQQQGITIVLTEHQLHYALEDADRLLVMHQGRMVLDGPPREVLQHDVTAYDVTVPPVVHMARQFTLPTLPLSVEEFMPAGVTQSPYLCQTETSPWERGHDSRSNADEPSALAGFSTKTGDPVMPLTPSLPNNPTPSGNGWQSEHTQSTIAGGSEPVLACREVASTQGQDTLLHDINLTVQRGECLAIVGANGAGKTTLIKHFNGLLRPAQGEVLVVGQPTRRTKVSQLARRVGMAFQHADNQFFTFTVRDEIAAGARTMGCYDADWMQEIVHLFHLQPLLDRSPYRLSGGEKKRVAFAAALVCRPALLVLDEPTAGQDFRFRQTLGSVLERLRDNGQTVMLVTHDLEFAEQYAHRWCVLADGRLLMTAPPSEIMSSNQVMQQAGLRPTQRFQLAGWLPHADGNGVNTEKQSHVGVCRRQTPTFTTDEHR